MRYRPKSIIYTVKCKPTLAFEEDKEERRWNLTETEENDDVLRDRCKWIRRFLKETGFESQSYVQGKVIDPAIKGVRNVLGSCLKSKSVKRVVFTSSISTLTSKDENERWRSIVGETCKIPIDRVLKTKASGWINTLIYVLSKLISEEESFRYEKERGLDLVSVIPTTV
ncbi:hypothetical protein IGI04_001675 [Brassica rapa subsp. trilocularis]|uniref:NAD(P)-binding domain-containing protein n=1 Tax=Brassica rapa subsp. trilocularis TaxID=1813537 RepID=A0ABQ7NTA6_BRACM|nr:hypothetical protein IGI04_001675 [Brassica rapa subsp. trilocularis]